MTSAALSRHEINALDRKSLTQLLELTGKTLLVYLKGHTTTYPLLFETASNLVERYPQYQMDITSKLDQYTAKYGFDQQMLEDARTLLSAQSILQRVDFNQLER